MERLQKYLAGAGVASRRKAEELIAAGRVEVNGRVVTELGTKVDPEVDRVVLDGKPVGGPQGRRYLLLYKPPGCVTTMSDPQGRPTAASYLAGVRERVFPVGRLDYDAEGAVLFTTDGELANRLAHPRYGHRRVYLVKVKGDTSAGAAPGTAAALAPRLVAALHLGEVDAPVAVARVGQAVRQLAVGGEEHRPLGVVVEPAHREDPLPDAGQIPGGGGAALRVGERGDAAGRLVEQEVALLLPLQRRLAVHRDQVARRVHLGAERRDGAAVHGHPALGDQLLGLAPRGDAGPGQELLEAFFRHFVSGGRSGPGLPPASPPSGAGGFSAASAARLVSSALSGRNRPGRSPSTPMPPNSGRKSRSTGSPTASQSRFTRWKRPSPTSMRIQTFFSAFSWTAAARARAGPSSSRTPATIRASASPSRASSPPFTLAR